LKKIVNKYWLFVVIAGSIIALDQITKAVVRNNIPFGGSWMPWDWLQPFFRFVHWENTGAAFGFFQGGGTIFAILAVIIGLFILSYYPQIPENEKLMRVAMAMQFAGAMGNLIDRIFRGPVTDFISVGDFPVFNVADSSITIGVGLLLLTFWLSERKEKSTEKSSKNEDSDVSENIADIQ